MGATLTDAGAREWRRFVWDKFGYRTHEGAVQRFHESRARTRIISCPARTSKSYAGAWDIVPDIVFHGAALALDPEDTETQRVWIVAPNYDTAKEFDYLWQAFVERGPKLGLGYKLGRHRNHPKQGDMEIELVWGTNARGEVVKTIIEVKTAANEKSLQSEQLDIVILSEAAELPEKVWTTYLRTRTGRSIWPTTPKIHAAWIHDLIENADRYPELNIEHFEFTGRANPRYNWENYWTEHQKAELQVTNEIKTFPPNPSKPPSSENGHDCWDELSDCLAMKEDGFAEQMGGKWTFHKGRIVPLREKPSERGHPAHVIHEDRAWFRHADLDVAFDYGFADGTCIGFWLVGDGQVCLRKSIYETGMTPDDVVEAVLSEVRWFGREYDQDRMLRRLIGDPKKPEVAELFRRRGLPIWDIDKHAQADRKAGHLELMNLLAIDPATGEPRMLVHADNKAVIAEWRKLRRNDRVRSEDMQTALIGDDHAYDMSRYYAATRPVKLLHKFVREEAWFERKRKQNVTLARRKQVATVRSAYGQNRHGGLHVGA